MNPIRRRAAAGALLAVAALGPLALAGCGGLTSGQPQSEPARARATIPRSVGRLTAIAKRRYTEESRGSAVRARLNQIARDSALRRALQSGNLVLLRRYVRREFYRVWYHRHASRVRITRGSHILIDVGVPFVVAPLQKTLRDAYRHPLATLQVSVQDLIGFVRYMHRNHRVDVLVRGEGPRHVRTSLSPAVRVSLPASGTVTVARRRYTVASFAQTGLGGEPLRIWILKRG